MKDIKLLVIKCKSMSGIGNMVMMTPMLSVLKDRGYRMDLVTDTNDQVVAEYFDTIYLFKDQIDLKKIKWYQYKHVIFTHPLNDFIDYQGKSNAIYDATIDFKKMSEYVANLKLLTQLGIPNQKVPPKLSYIVKDEEQFDIAIHLGIFIPNPSWDKKIYLLNHYIKLIKKLKSDGYKVCLVGHKRKEHQKISQAIMQTDVIDRSSLSIQGTLNTLHNSKVLITGDTGVMHLGAVVPNTKIIALFGPTLVKKATPTIQPSRWHVLKSKICSECFGTPSFWKCKQRCIDDITPKEIYNKVKEII